MVTQSSGSDKRIGYTALFAALGVLGAVGMYFYSIQGAQAESGWSFAVAMTGAAAMIAAVHIYA